VTASDQRVNSRAKLQRWGEGRMRAILSKKSSFSSTVKPEVTQKNCSKMALSHIKKP
jgi:hypothetical protein